MPRLTEADSPTKPRVKKLENAGKQLHKLTKSVIQDGVGPLAGSAAYAEARLSKTASGHRGGSGNDRRAPATSTSGAPDSEAAIRRIVRECVGAAGTQGFVTGLGGFTTLPVTLPASIAGSLIINARMVGAIAHLRGYDLDDPHTQAMMMLTIAGSSAQGAAAQLGVKLGQQAAQQAIRAVPIAVIRKINQRAGFYLLAKYGTERSAVTLVKFIPGVGGLVGGTVDATLTRAIGQTAKKVFPA